MFETTNSSSTDKKSEPNQHDSPFSQSLPKQSQKSPQGKETLNSPPKYISVMQIDVANDSTNKTQELHQESSRRESELKTLDDQNQTDQDTDSVLTKIVNGVANDSMQE
jgi:hypothetical protein